MTSMLGSITSVASSQGCQYNGKLSQITAFVLAKNEEANLDSCLQAIRCVGLSAVVLDSHSVDRTSEIALQRGCAIEPYNYQDHLEALRYVCQERTSPNEFALVLDADMVISAELITEAQALLIDCNADVALAPVRMHWNGRPLNRGSLYPPKPFMFRGGTHYFEARGHGEVLRHGVRTVVTQHELIHNDLKSMDIYLTNQVRYSASLIRRRLNRQLSWRDRLRATPIMMLIMPAYSYFVCGGILSGRLGVGYALDRLIAEAIMYRQYVAARSALQKDPEGQNSI